MLIIKNLIIESLINNNYSPLKFFLWAYWSQPVQINNQRALD